MAIKYKGEVSFKDTEGREFVLRLGTFQWMNNQERLNALLREGKGQDYQTGLFHLALVNGAEAQKELTLEEASEIRDDIGYVKADDYMKKTKFGQNVHDAAETEKAERAAATARAAAMIKPRIEKLRKKGGTDVAAALDDLEKFIDGLQAKEGSANPTDSTTPSN